MDPAPTDGIRVPSYLVPVIASVIGFVSGALVAENLETYWRPALVPVLAAFGAIFVAKPIAKNRMAAASKRGADFGAAAGYAQALEDQPPPAKKAPAKKAAPRKRA